MTKNAAQEAVVEAGNDAAEAEASLRAGLLLVPAPPMIGGTDLVLVLLAIGVGTAGTVTVAAIAGMETVVAALARPASSSGVLETGNATIAAPITSPPVTRVSGAGSLSVRVLEPAVVLGEATVQEVADMTARVVAMREAVVAVAMTVVMIGAMTGHLAAVVDTTVAMVVEIGVVVSTEEVVTVTGVVAMVEVAIATAAVVVVAMVVTVVVTGPLARVLHSSLVTGTARAAGAITLLLRPHAIAVVLPGLKWSVSRVPTGVA